MIGTKVLSYGPESVRASSLSLLNRAVVEIFTSLPLGKLEVDAIQPGEPLTIIHPSLPLKYSIITAIPEEIYRRPSPVHDRTWLRY